MKTFTLKDGAKDYIDSLPRYVKWPNSDSFAIDTPGAFLLSIDPCCSHWYSLIETISELTSWDKNYIIDGSVFKSMAGVEDFLFDKVAFRWQNLPTNEPKETIDTSLKDWEFYLTHARMADTATPFVDDMEVDLISGLCFESSVMGAISAMFFMTRFQQFTRYWHALYGNDHIFILEESQSLSKRNELLQRYWPLKFGKPFSTQISIPWGFRLEVSSSNEYTIRCLADSMTSGLYDISVSIKDGIVKSQKRILLYANRRMCY